MEAPRSSRPHILRMNRMLRSFAAFYDAYCDAFFDVYDDEDIPVTGEITVPISSADILKWLQRNFPEQPVNLRTVQRDYAVIAEALEYLRALRA